MKFFLVVIQLILFATASGQNIYLIPALHGMHEVNEKYNYDSLKTFISNLKPDIIAVEIREEDINEDEQYLDANYPFEMFKVKDWFPEVTVEGFDWLGKEIEGERISENYWEQMPLKILQQQLNKDATAAELLQSCTDLIQKRIPVLKEGTLQEIITTDTALSRQYYECLEEKLAGTLYQPLSDFYKERNIQMAKRLKEIIAKYPEKTIVAITGADHLYFLLKEIPNATTPNFDH